MHARKIEVNISIPYVRLFQYKVLKNFKYSNVQISQLILNLNVVSRAGSFSRHAAHMLSQCEYHDFCDIAQL